MLTVQGWYSEIWAVVSSKGGGGGGKSSITKAKL